MPCCYLSTINISWDQSEAISINTMKVVPQNRFRCFYKLAQPGHCSNRANLGCSRKPLSERKLSSHMALADCKGAFRYEAQTVGALFLQRRQISSMPACVLIDYVRTHHGCLAAACLRLCRARRLNHHSSSSYSLGLPQARGCCQHQTGCCFLAAWRN